MLLSIVIVVSNATYNLWLLWPFIVAWGSIISTHKVVQTFSTLHCECEEIHNNSPLWSIIILPSSTWLIALGSMVVKRLDEWLHEKRLAVFWPKNGWLAWKAQRKGTFHWEFSFSALAFFFCLFCLISLFQRIISHLLWGLAEVGLFRLIFFCLFSSYI